MMVRRYLQVTIYASPGFIPPALLGDPNDQPKDDRLVAAINMERSEVPRASGTTVALCWTPSPPSFSSAQIQGVEHA